MDISLGILELIISIMLIAAEKLSVKYASNKWKLLNVGAVIIAAALAGFVSFDIMYVGVYVAAVILMLELFFDSARVRNTLSAVAAFIIVVTLVVCLASPGYHKTNYLANFDEGFNTMKEHYILDREKGIDWDELYAKYSPGFAKAAKTNDPVLNINLWQEFTREFYDGHVSYVDSNGDMMVKAMCEVYGNDYGLSILRTAGGEYVAVNVEGGDNCYSIYDEIKDFKEVKSYIRDDVEEGILQFEKTGIKNGTVITAWDGKPIEDYFDRLPYTLFQVPDKGNEEFYRPLYVAGIGGDTVRVSYIGDDGGEKTAELRALGAYLGRLYKSVRILDDGINITNLEWKSVNEDTALIRISEMAYDQKTYTGSDYTEMTDKVREELLKQKENGIKNIIFDLRSNGGGSPFMVTGIASLFAPEGEHIYSYCSVIDENTASYKRDENGKYPMGEGLSYHGENLFPEGRIILLVNAETVSAGDDMTNIMSEYPGVTIMGFTKSNCSCQAVTGVGLDGGQLTFSAVPDLDAEGNILIDSGTDHIGKVPIDVIVPFDQDAVSAIFDRGDDYLLNYAVAYVSSK